MGCEIRRRNCAWFLALMVGLLQVALSTMPANAQTFQYSESFTNGTGYGSGTPQWDNWLSFRAQLNGSYQSITISGSLDPIGRSCTNPTIATQIANALNAGTASAFNCDGRTWRTGTCGSGIELTVGPTNACTCMTGNYTVRPMINPGNPHWGGAGSTTCSAPSQTLTVTVIDTTAPTLSINAPNTHDSSTFNANFQFSESVTGFDISDISITNGSLSSFTQNSLDSYSVTVTPTGPNDVDVSVAAGSASDYAGNLLSNNDQATIFYLPSSGGSTIDRYSEDFTNGVGYSPGSVQWDNWLAFRAGLTGAYHSITIKGSLDTTGRSCTNSTIATQIANALNAGTASAFNCDGMTWRTGTCGSGIELTVGPTNACTCMTGNYTVRPMINPGNPHWGGAGSNTCNAPSQTLTVELVSDPIDPTVTITGVPSTTDGSTPFVVTYTFSEDITGMTLSDVTAALSNGTASGLVETIPMRRFTVTITPNGGGDVVVGLNANAVQDMFGNGNAAATDQVAVLGSASATISLVVDISNVTSLPTTLQYSVTIENDGALALNSPTLLVTLTQSGGGLTLDAPPSLDSGDVNTNGILDPGEIWLYLANYTVTQSNMDDAGDIIVNADFSASGFSTISAGPDSTTIAANAALSVSKTADFTTDVTAGQTITYTYLVSNVGNQSISNISLADSHNGSGPAPVPSGEILSNDSSPIGDSNDGTIDAVWDFLAPGDEVSFTATYTVTQSDIDNLQ